MTALSLSISAAERTSLAALIHFRSEGGFYIEEVVQTFRSTTGAMLARLVLDGIDLEAPDQEVVRILMEQNQVTEFTPEEVCNLLKALCTLSALHFTSS